MEGPAWAGVPLHPGETPPGVALSAWTRRLNRVPMGCTAGGSFSPFHEIPKEVFPAAAGTCSKSSGVAGTLTVLPVRGET